jgi:hypothetical protein
MAKLDARHAEDVAPDRLIRAPSSARERTPSFRYTLARFASTARGVRNRASATWRVVRPEAISWAPLTSVSVSAPDAGGRPLTPEGVPAWGAGRVRPPTGY